MNRISARSLGSFVLCVILPTTVAAQVPDTAVAATPQTEAARWFVGGSVGVPGYGGDVAQSLFTVALHGTRLKRGGIGPEFSVGTIPRVLFEGVIAVGARGGLAWAAPISEDVLLVPSAGVSFLGGGGSGFSAAELGANVGISAIVLESVSSGLRMGVTWHRFREMGGSLWLLEVGFVKGR